mmetsp:Transcript_17770/g.30046  ORF Transcript_17770/g.30046 Transcript_17770/m.30046 type:complete len:660 (-) Transcript_17770:93-2072(-)
MSGLRLRPQQQSPRVGDNTTHGSCNSVRKSPLSPQSFNAILHPPLRNSCPAKIPTFRGNNGNTLSSRMRRRCTLRLNVTKVFYLGVALSIGFILGLQYVALQSIGDQNNHGIIDSNKYTVPNPKSNVRRRVERRHPRIAHHVVRNESFAFNHDSTTTFWKRLLSYFTSREKQIIDDPMLHHDGWAATTTSDKHDDDNYNENNGECVPMAPWQTTSYPNCNSIHEIDLVLSSGKGSIAFAPLQTTKMAAAASTTMRRRWLTQHPWQHLQDEPHRKNHQLNPMMGMIKQEDITFLGQGWFRAAWKMDVEGLEQYDEEEEDYYQKESVVLKTLRYEREFLQEYYELHRRDALAMERLTASPYVLDVYGYCGQSAINELANFGIEGMSSLEKVARGFRGLDIEPVSKIKLQLAAMVAQGVSHLHSIDYPDFVRDGYPGNSGSVVNIAGSSNATLVHYDLNPRNIAIVKRGKPKLNDFNVAEFLMWNPKTNTKCGFEGRFKEPWWRAPEEMQVQMTTEYPNPPPLTEKVDVYALGNILWDLLTTHSPWGKMKKERQDEVRPKVAKGELPKLPPPYDKITLKDPALNALKDAMYKCLRLNPEDRPSAGEIAEELAEALGNLPEGFGDKSKFKEEIEKFDRKKDKKEKDKKKKDDAHGSKIAASKP